MKKRFCVGSPATRSYLRPAAQRGISSHSGARIVGNQLATFAFSCLSIDPPLFVWAHSAMSQSIHGAHKKILLWHTGSKKSQAAQENAGAIGWQMSAEEHKRVDEA